MQTPMEEYIPYIVDASTGFPGRAEQPLHA
jgi:hypothetical protein